MVPCFRALWIIFFIYGAAAIFRAPQYYKSLPNSCLGPINHKLASIAARLSSVRGGGAHSDVIFYKNAQGAIFGPFSKGQIQQWVDRGLFPPGVPMAASRDGPFIPRETFLLSAPHTGLSVAPTHHLPDPSEERGAGGATAAAAVVVGSPSSDSSSRNLPARSVYSIMTHESAWASASSSGVGPLVHRLRLGRPVMSIQQLLNDVRSALTLPAALRSQLINVAPGVLRSSGYYVLILTLSHLLNLALLLRLISIAVGAVARVFAVGQPRTTAARAAVKSTCDAIWTYPSPSLSPVDAIKRLLSEILSYHSAYLPRSAMDVVNVLRQWVPVDSVAHMIILGAIYFLNSEYVQPAAEAGVMHSIQGLFRAVAVGSSSVLRMKYNMNIEAAASFRILASFAVPMLILTTSMALGYLFTPIPYVAVILCILWEAAAQLRLHSLRPSGLSPQSHFNKIKVERLENVMFSDASRDQLERFPDLKIAVEAERARGVADWFVSSFPSQQSLTRYVQSQLSRQNAVRRLIQLIFILSVARALGEYSTSSSFKLIQRFIASGLRVGLTDAMRCVRIESTSWRSLISATTSTTMQYALPLMLWVIQSNAFTTGLDSLRVLEDLFAERQPLKQPYHMLSDPRLHTPSSSSSAAAASQEGRWTSDGPEKLAGVYFDQVMAIGGGRVKLRDLTMHLPAGQVSALVGVGAGGMDEVEAVLQLLWAGDGSSDVGSWVLRLQRGGVFVQGRGLRDWDTAALQRRLALMKPGDVQLPVTMGALSGIDPALTRGGAPLQTLPEKYRRAIEMSGVGEVIRLLPNGINTDLNELPPLSPGQKYRASLCRALTALDRDVVLLHLGTEFMGEYEEERFLTALRAAVRPDQVVVVTSAKLSMTQHVDHAVVFERGVAPRTIKERANAEP